MKRNLLFKSFLPAIMLFAGVTLASAQDNLLEKASKVFSDLDQTQLTVTDGTVTYTTPTKNKGLRIRMKFAGYSITKGNAFIVVEYSGITNKNNTTARQLTIDGADYQKNTADTYYDVMELSNGHKVAIISPLTKGLNGELGASGNQLLDLYRDKATGETMSLTVLDVILTADNSDSNGDVTVYNVGLYTIRDIKDKYLASISDSKKTFQIVENVNNNRIRLNHIAGSTDATIQVNAATQAGNVDEKGLSLILAAIGEPTATNTQLDLRGATGVTPAKTDLLSSWIGTRKDLNILFSQSNYNYFPTMSRMAYVVERTYWNYKDGISPKLNGRRSDSKWTTNLYDYTRNFTEGYNSCALPFDITIDELPEGLTAYTFDVTSTSSEVKFTKATTGTIAATTPFIIKADETGLYVIKAAATPNAIVTTNDANYALQQYYETVSSDETVKFIASFANQAPTQTGSKYGITADGQSLAKMGTGVKASWYRAFVNVPLETARINVSFNDDETTAISGVESISAKADGHVYSLSGQRVSAPRKGIYVVNGKKVMFK